MKTFEVQYIRTYPNGMRMVGVKTKCVGPTKEDAAFHYMQYCTDMFPQSFDSKEHFLKNTNLEKDWIFKECH